MRKHRPRQKRPQRQRVPAIPLQSLRKACGAYLVLDPKSRSYPEEEKERILRAYRERGSMRAIERIFGVSRNTLSRWLEKRDVSSLT